MSTFYKKCAQAFTCWGCSFDSLLELKYAISIAGDFEFLRAAIHIFYNPRTRETSDYIREGFRRYVPDFLIRDKITGDAFLVEIKPEGFDDTVELELRKSVAENYIRRKSFDWKYKVIYGNEIILDENAQRLYEQCLALKFSVELNERPIGDLHFNPNEEPLFSKRPANGITAFIMFGDTCKPKNNFMLKN
jgi:hypothetical protein